TGGALRFDHASSNETYSFSRTTDFSPTPTAMMYKFTLSVPSISQASGQPVRFRVGSGFSTSNVDEADASTYGQFGVDFITTGVGGTSRLRDMDADTESADLPGTQTIAWVLN